MMDTLQTIMTRRSVRHFTSQPVTDAELESLLRAAMQAPSSGNGQPWYFIVLTDHNIMDEVTKFHPTAAAIKEAPLAILICGDETLEGKPGRWMMDCAAASQNMLLAAHGLGLGSVWLGIHPDPARIEGVSKLMGLPPQIHPLSIVAIGRAAATPEPVDRYKPERVKLNHW